MNAQIDRTGEETNINYSPLLESIAKTLSCDTGKHVKVKEYVSGTPVYPSADEPFDTVRMPLNYGYQFLFQEKTRLPFVKRNTDLLTILEFDVDLRGDASKDLRTGYQSKIAVTATLPIYESVAHLIDEFTRKNGIKKTFTARETSPVSHGLF